MIDRFQHPSKGNNPINLRNCPLEYSLMKASRQKDRKYSLFNVGTVTFNTNMSIMVLVSY